MENIKITKTVNIKVGDRNFNFTEDEAFGLYKALAKIFVIGLDEELQPESLASEEERDDEAPKKDHNLTDLEKIINDLIKRKGQYPTPAVSPLTPYIPSQPLKPFEIWCSIVGDAFVK